MVQEGDQLIVDKLDLEDGKSFDVEEVLAVFDEKAENVSLGTPTLKAKVTCEVVQFQK
ncbi:bL21 family ribosomal protein [Patescibacteria group bacterium]|nr:bL21 family ribosomal protein [Patescibacteria group bacterium]MBU1758916.1 bL21 family ribosomal protein [Patescibacteria group bacterium]